VPSLSPLRCLSRCFDCHTFLRTSLNLHPIPFLFFQDILYIFSVVLSVSSLHNGVCFLPYHTFIIFPSLFFTCFLQYVVISFFPDMFVSQFTLHSLFFFPL
jgi:hypothetical protein